MSQETKDQVQAIIDDHGINPTSKTHMLLGCIIGLLDDKSDMDRRTYFQDIIDFHVKFNQQYGGPVRSLPHEMREFRTSFLDEELSEYKEAVKSGDLVLQIDALFDLAYVALGTAYLMGVNFDDVWKEGHASNMSKELVAKGKGKMGFTVHKGDNYFEPNFQQFVPVSDGLTLAKLNAAHKIMSEPQKMSPIEFDKELGQYPKPTYADE